MVGGCPKSLRCDMGTENKVVEKIQKAFHSLFNDTPSTKPYFIYGKSVHNQRIEAWWSILRKHSSQFWMNLFQSLKDEDYFCGTFLDKSLIQFCFMGLIQEDLNQVVMEWNVHKIRKSRNSIAPTGRPSIMFDMPSLYGTKSYCVDIPNFAIEALYDVCSFNDYPCDKDVYDLCRILISENGYSQVTDHNSAVHLYIQLRNSILTLIN
ncbi:hypothetical protein JTB14_002627 [Gonioctena quinquepunctata]|nr:hypothetical protein JTB14_002627 [Gonioctena quinquepunctata]